MLGKYNSESNCHVYGSTRCRIESGVRTSHADTQNFTREFSENVRINAGRILSVNEQPERNEIWIGERILRMHDSVNAGGAKGLTAN